MEAVTAGCLLREVRLRHNLSQEDLAIRARTTRSLVAEFETGRISPPVEALREFLELMGEDLILDVEERRTGIDVTLNQGNLELSVGHRVQRGLAFADVVRGNRFGGSTGLGKSLQPGPLLTAFDDHRVDFVVIGSIAGLAHGSAYPTYDLDLAYAGFDENLNRLKAALGEVGVMIDGRALAARNALSFDTRFGTLDILGQVPGVETYAQLRRDSSREVLAGVLVRVASLNHLIAMKRAAGKRKDQLMVMEYVVLADEIRRREADEAS